MTPDVRSAEWRAEMRALADAATAGPWVAHHDEQGQWNAVYADWTKLGIRGCLAEDVTLQTDAAFIAASREAVPALLDAYERIAAELAERDELCWLALDVLTGPERLQAAFQPHSKMASSQRHESELSNLRNRLRAALAQEAPATVAAELREFSQSCEEWNGD